MDRLTEDCCLFVLNLCEPWLSFWYAFSSTRSRVFLSIRLSTRRLLEFDHCLVHWSCPPTSTSCLNRLCVHVATWYEMYLVYNARNRGLSTMVDVVNKTDVSIYSKRRNIQITIKHSTCDTHAQRVLRYRESGHTLTRSTYVRLRRRRTRMSQDNRPLRTWIRLTGST